LETGFVVTATHRKTAQRATLWRWCKPAKNATQVIDKTN
jgi:hypothetical protein